MGTVTLHIDADSAKAVDAYLKMTDAERAAVIEAKRLGVETTKSGHMGGAAVKGLGRELGSMVMQWVSVTAAVRIATSALRAFHEEQSKAAQGLKAGEAGIGKLAQLAGGDRGKLLSMMEETKGSRRQGLTQESAAALQFTLESVGLQRHRGMFADLGGITDPAALAEGVSTLQAAMGIKETGGASAVASKLLMASAVSKMGVGQFAPSATTAAETVRMVKGTDEELLASLAVASRGKRSGEIAASTLDALARVMVKKGITDKGLIGGVEAIAAKGMSERALVAYLGDALAVKGFSQIQANLPEIKSLAAALTVEGALPERASLVRRTIGILGTVPELAMPRATRVEQEKEKIEAERLGFAELEREQVLARYRAESIATGEHWFGRFVTSKVSEFQGYLGASPAFIKRGIEAGTGFDLGPEGEAAGHLEQGAAALRRAEQRRQGQVRTAPGGEP